MSQPGPSSSNPPSMPTLTWYEENYPELVYDLQKEARQQARSVLHECCPGLLSSPTDEEKAQKSLDDLFNDLMDESTKSRKDHFEAIDQSLAHGKRTHEAKVARGATLEDKESPKHSKKPDAKAKGDSSDTTASKDKSKSEARAVKDSEESTQAETDFDGDIAVQVSKLNIVGTGSQKVLEEGMKKADDATGKKHLNRSEKSEATGTIGATEDNKPNLEKIETNAAGAPSDPTLAHAYQLLKNPFNFGLTADGLYGFNSIDKKNQKNPRQSNPPKPPKHSFGHMSYSDHVAQVRKLLFPHSNSTEEEETTSWNDIRKSLKEPKKKLVAPPQPSKSCQSCRKLIEHCKVLEEQLKKAWDMQKVYEEKAKGMQVMQKRILEMEAIVGQMLEDT